MKSKLLLLALLLAVPALAQTPFSGTVVGVVDGDTLVIRNGYKIVNVRVEGIDAPERSQFYGTNATHFTRAMTYGKVVSVTPIKIDRYGRTVARVNVNGQDLSSALVGSGLAWHYKKYSSDSSLKALENSARSRGAGLWALSATPPWDFRKQSRSSTYYRAPAYRVPSQKYISKSPFGSSSRSYRRTNPYTKPYRYKSYTPRYKSYTPRYKSYTPRYKSYTPRYKSYTPRYKSYTPRYKSYGSYSPRRRK